MMFQSRYHPVLWLTAGVLFLGSCGDSSDSGTMVADTSSVDGAVGTGLSLLHVRLLHAGPRETAMQNNVTAEFVAWDVEVVEQRLGVRDTPYPSQIRLIQDLSVYNHRDMVGQTYAWTGGVQRPVLTEGAHYLIVTMGRRGATNPVVPNMLMMVPLDGEGRTTEALFNVGAGTPIGNFMPPATLSPPALDGDAGTDGGASGPG
jgi:hypothetical protein